MPTTIKCANCASEAVYAYAVSESRSIYYCGKDLPKFLRGKNAASLLKSVIVKPTPAPKRKKQETVETPTEE